MLYVLTIIMTTLLDKYNLPQNVDSLKFGDRAHYNLLVADSLVNYCLQPNSIE